MYYSIVGWRFFTTSLLLAMILSFRWYFGESPDTARQISLTRLIMAEYILTAVYLLAGRFTKLRENKYSLTAQMTIDLILVSILLIFSGGVYSQFLILYTFVVLVIAGILDRTSSTILTLLATIVPTVLASVHWYTGYGLQLGRSPETLRDLVWRTSYQTVFLIVGAVASQFLGERIRKTSTALKRSETDIRFLQALNDLIIRSMPSGLLVVDGEDRILTSNAACRHILGDDLNRALPLFSIGRKHLGERLEEEYDGDSYKVIGYTCVPFGLPNSSEGTLILFQDLTQTKQLQAKLRREEKLSAVGRLGANLAHEIRNPLAGISNAIQLLSEGNASQTDNNMHRVVNREMARLEALLDDFLSYSSSAKLVRVLFMPPEEAAGIIETNAFPVTLTIEPQGNWSYFGFREVFIQILYNLLKNASQWAHRDTPQIICTLARNESGIQIRVEDNGTGLAPGTEDLIWEPFSSARSSGTGLGLSIVANLTQEAGGQYTVKSGETLGGACFEIFLPSIWHPDKSSVIV